MVSLKIRLRNLLFGPLKWPTFFLTKRMWKENLKIALIFTLYIEKKYQTADRMVNFLFKDFRKSLSDDLTPLETSLEMQRHFWERYLSNHYSPRAVVRLAGTYERLGYLNAAHHLLYLSFRTETVDRSILKYFAMFCLRYKLLSDAQCLSKYLNTEDQEKHQIDKYLSQISQSERSLLIDNGKYPYEENKIQNPNRLTNYCELISEFFDQLITRDNPNSSEYPHIVSITFQDITHDNRVKKIAAHSATRGYRSTLICSSEKNKEERGHIGTAAVLKFPIKSDLQNMVRTKIHEHQIYKYLVDARNLNRQVLRIRKSECYAFSETQQNLLARFKVLESLVRIQFFTTLLLITKIVNITWGVFSNFLKSQDKKTYQHFQNDHLDFQEAFGPQIERLKPDLIHVNDFHLIGIGVTAARNLKRNGIHTKVIYDAHELVEGIEHRYSPLWKSEVAHFIDSVDGVVCISELQAEVMKEIYKLDTLPSVVANAPQVTLVDNTGPTIRDDLGIEGKILTYHGWASESRGVETIVRSLEFLPSNFHLALMVMGRDDFLASLQKIESKIRKEAGLQFPRLHFLPYVTPDRLPHYLSTSDMSIISLLPIGNGDRSNHHIAMPNKLYESVQAKVPVITSDMPALSVFVNEHKIGSVYKAGSSSGLAEAVLGYLGSELDKEQIFNDGLLQLCSWEYQIEQLFNLYEETLGDHVHPKEPMTSIDLKFIPFENFTLRER